MSIGGTLYGTADDFFKGMRLGLSPSVGGVEEKGKPRHEPSIRVYIEDMDRARYITRQAPWPETVKCPKCRDKAQLMMVVDDETGRISEVGPRGAKVWPHDSVTIAHYFCSDCGEIEARWNQA